MNVPRTCEGSRAGNPLLTWFWNTLDDIISYCRVQCAGFYLGIHWWVANLVEMNNSESGSGTYIVFSGFILFHTYQESCDHGLFHKSQVCCMLNLRLKFECMSLRITDKSSRISYIQNQRVRRNILSPLVVFTNCYIQVRIHVSVRRKI